MKKIAGIIAFSLVSFLSCSGSRARPVSFVRVPLTICLTNEAGIPLDTVKAVETRVSLIFKESAIELRWLNTRSTANGPSSLLSCGRLSYPDRLMVHWLPKALRATPDVLGEAFLDEQDAGVIADLFLDHVRDVEAETKVGFTTLLAYVTAHEVGHLLLGANSHSAYGIMKGHFYGQNLVTMRHAALTFEREEEVRMHSRILGDPLPILPAKTR